MEYLKFGMNAEPTASSVSNDFVEYTQKEGGNYNPYNKSFFNDPTNMTECKDKGRITSIPSPYARMHITDLAFQEYNCGTGTMSASRKASRKLSADYLRAMSHCLDMFEIMYRSDSFDWKEIGITLHKIQLVSTNSTDPKIQDILFDENGKLTSLGHYTKTLDVFRDEYRKVIKSKGIANYMFDFSSLYIFKYKGKTFASTSPFTGFSAKADCNISEAGIKVKNRILLSSDPVTWKALDERDVEFKQFLYLLLKDTGLKDIFVNLFNALNNTFDADTKAKIDNLKFVQEPMYQKYNIGHELLQKVATVGPELYIRPDGLDCSYLKYLLYIQTPVELTIEKDDYDIALDERRFPSVGGELKRWFGVNDILADSLFVLTYEINDNYMVVPFVDKTGDEKPKRRCLLPVKRKALDFFSVEDLVNNMRIERRAKDIYAVALMLQLSNGGTVVLRREYNSKGEFPNGRVVSGEEMKPFAFGIYPFVKSTKNKNIYKVLFYNSFEADYKVSFFKRNAQGSVQEFLETECQKNKTNDINVNKDELPVNCEYHHLEPDEGLEFAELSVSGIGTSLIVPKMRVVHDLPGIVNVGIDLGTSNTYIAYSYQPEGSDEVEDITEICTNHKDWNELTFMNKKCEKADDPNAPEKNREDLYLRTSDAAGAKPSDEWLDSQLCEFIPSRIDPNMGDESYCFPIPTVINILRQDAQRRGIDSKQNFIPLLHCAIPFAYYERGTRVGLQKNYYDIIQDGSKFKWFYHKDEDGDWKTNDYAKAFFKAFVSELLFIVRSHLVSSGYDLKQTRILWSYPLSFSPELVRDYVSTWNESYRQFINPQVRANELEDFVKYTNESRSPIFECLTNPSSVDHLTLLVDIGGGSTDIIGYKNRKPRFISSFGFAGNSLYLDGGLNTVEQGSMKDTILSRYVAKQNIFKQDTNRQNTKKISKDDSISTLMNYGFTKAPDEFRKIFDNQGPKFMLLLHNAALMYHMAQLCYAKSADEAPVEVFLTGNGSKLFYMNQGYKDMIRTIFEHVYCAEDGGTVTKEDIVEMKIRKPNDPKAATVRGALKGYSKGQLATNEDAAAMRIVMLGDKSTVYNLKEDEGGASVSYDGDYREAVKQNVIDFVEMFYSKIYTVNSPVVSKEQALRAVEYVKNNGRLKIAKSALLSDSLFFQYVALLMEKLSFDLAEKFE